MRTAETHVDAPIRFTFLTNHAHVILLIARNADIRMRQMAMAVGITERAVQRIVEELAESGYVVINRVGRRNQYQVVPQMPLRHSVEAQSTIGDLIQLINGSGK